MSQNTKNACPGKKTSIGGQALIEGIMMRGPETTSMAVRHVSGEIVLESWPTAGGHKPKVLRAPFIRGIFNFIDSLRYGYKCLMRSAELSGLEDEEEPPKGKKDKQEPPAGAFAISTAPDAQSALEREQEVVLAAEMAQEDTAAACGLPEAAVSVAEIGAEEAAPAVPAAPPAEKAAKEESKGEKVLMTFLMVLSSILGVALAIGLFLWLPSFLYTLLKGAVPALDSSALRGVFEGVFRILLFIGYMLLVSLMKDIKRVFMYHGAEHKAIFCYEAGEELTVENVRKQRRFHPRCGTSFMLLMLLLGVIVSMIIRVDDPLLRTAIKLLTIPLVVGIGYELIKLAGRKTNWFTKAISAPGMWLQHITTKEPDDSMIECAIAALKEVIPADPEADNW